MTNQSRSSSQPAALAAQLAPASLTSGLLVFMPFAIPVFTFSPAAFSAPTQPAVTPAPAPRTTASSTSAPGTNDTVPPPPPTRAPAGAGLPAPLIALLRGAEGPFLANEVFSETPTEALLPIEEEVPAAEWYAITRGRFVGVVDQFALGEVAIAGVAGSARKSYTTQGLALNAFNRALTWGGVQVA
ncbi:hypothetical protein C8F04DRAFT_1248540 [Mycena alexandri]|uniref:Uncharacterized protein n=1 Tax=Mycena alexandri TaxID=1745969 RepID=A0AAD6TGS7_9AGAR|nr:hypothetical protein C8F04DRAFT_1248540 [Mycena alexandri]